MKRFTCFALIVAAMAAIVLLPIGEARAETADEVRKRVFAALIKKAPGGWAELILFTDGKSFRNYGRAPKLEQITCSDDKLPAPKFYFNFNANDIAGGMTIVTIPQLFPVYTQADKEMPIAKGTLETLISITSYKLAKKQTMYVRHTFFVPGSGKEQDNDSLKYEGMAAYASHNGHIYDDKIYMYRFQINKFMRDAATDLCSETNADKLLAIAKRHKLIE